MDAAAWVWVGWTLTAEQPGPRREGESGPWSPGRGSADEVSVRLRTAEPNRAWTGDCGKDSTYGFVCGTCPGPGDTGEGAPVLRTWLPRGL